MTRSELMHKFDNFTRYEIIDALIVCFAANEFFRLVNIKKFLKQEIEMDEEVYKILKLVKKYIIENEEEK